MTDRLRDELVRAAVRRYRRRVARARVGGVAAVAIGIGALAAAVVGLARPAPARAEVRVQHATDRVVVTLVDLEHDPGRIEVALRDAGVRAQVTAVAVGPSDVGRFVGDATSTALPPELQAVDAVGGTFAGFSVPSGWPGSLELRVGRPARAGEPYATFADALAPGEALACEPLLGRTAGELAERLAGRPVAVVVEALGPSGAVLLPLAGVPGTDHASWVVVAADATSHRDVVVRVAPPPAAPVRPRPC